MPAAGASRRLQLATFRTVEETCALQGGRECLLTIRVLRPLRKMIGRVVDRAALTCP